MDFSDALNALKAGHQVFRRVWESGTHIQLQSPDEHSFMTEEYVFISSDVNNSRSPWLCSQLDLLATDWELL